MSKWQQLLLKHTNIGGIDTRAKVETAMYYKMRKRPRQNMLGEKEMQPIGETAIMSHVDEASECPMVKGTVEWETKRSHVQVRE